MKTKKLLSILLALMMMLSVVPMYASAAPIKLTRNNIEIVPPSVSPTEITYGQTLGELTITGGEVWYIDGTGAKTQVSGYFTVYNATVKPAATESTEVLIKFVSTDENYTSSATYRSANCTYTGTWPTIKVKAEAVATLAEAPVASSLAVGGKKIHTSVLSGGKIVDGQGNDITDQGKWQWADTTIVVNESGTYTAVWKATNNDYDPITVDVYIAVEAVQTKAYFTDENGNETIPEIRWTVNSALSDNVLVSYIEKLTANCGEFSASHVQTSNVDITALGEYECTVRITPKSEYYSTEDLAFKLIVEPIKITVTGLNYNAVGKYIFIKPDQTKAPGTYAVYVDGALAGSGLDYGSDGIHCPWETDVSGTYSVKVVYNPTENDKYTMEDYTTDLEVNVARALTTEGVSSTLRVNGKPLYSSSIVNGDEITLECNLEVFAGWEIKDTQGNTVDLGLTTEQLKAQVLTFTMPDYDLVVTAKSTLDEDEPGTEDPGTDEPGTDEPGTDEPGIEIPDIEIPDIDIDFDGMGEGDHWLPIVNFFKNIVEMIKDFIQSIGNFFGSLSIENVGGLITQ